MKIVLAFLLVALAAVCVYATSEPHCEGVTCDPETCPKHECQCGSHKDACGCCDFCNKCLNEECHPEHNDRCAEGLHCVKKVIGEEVTPVPGHCEHEHEGSSTAAPEVHVKVPDSEAPVDEHHEHHAHHEGGEHAKSGDDAHHE
uniref:Putative metastriate insulin growth factor binding protein n=1 Tax=Rhipicephalus pulchellus TaxID=72859 RepID=L7MC44_RHIPC